MACKMENIFLTSLKTNILLSCLSKENLCCFNCRLPSYFNNGFIRKRFGRSRSHHSTVRDRCKTGQQFGVNSLLWRSNEQTKQQIIGFANSGNLLANANSSKTAVLNVNRPAYLVRLFLLCMMMTFATRYIEAGWRNWDSKHSWGHLNPSKNFKKATH